MGVGVGLGVDVAFTVGVGVTTVGTGVGVGVGLTVQPDTNKDATTSNRTAIAVIGFNFFNPYRGTVTVNPELS